jgi:GTPase SAR1 family protein
MTQNSSVAQLAEQLLALLEELGREDQITIGRLLHQRLGNPQSYVTLVGETSTGKSSLINGAFQAPFLPVSAEPTTGAVVHVVCRDDEPPRFSAINKDASQQALTPEQFQTLCRNPADHQLRLQVRARPSDPGLMGLHLFDTPGYNSLVADHEEVLRSFLPESDAVVLVCAYDTGFGQVDQELFELVRSATEQDPAVPFLMVINRVPESAAPRRIQEMTGNAADSLRREPELHLIHVAGVDPQTGKRLPPDARAVWARVVELVGDPRRQAQIHQKLLALLLELVDEVDDDLSLQAAAAAVPEEELQSMQEQQAELRSALGRSEAAVDAFAGRLQSAMRPAIGQAAEQLLQALCKEVDESDKWLGKEDCIAWISGHSLPFKQRAATNGLELLVASELQRLDDELAEIANTARQRIERTISLRSDAAAEFSRKLAVSLGKRMAGGAVQGGLRSIGGVGGVAAGAGNLVKMAVKRLGSIVDKTFSRGVYTTIGKIFTKRVVQAAGVGLSVAVDALVFVVDAKRWRGSLKEKLGEGIRAWQQTVEQAVYESELPRLTKANRESVLLAYGELLDQVREAMQARDRASAGRTESIGKQRARLAGLRQEIARITEVS